MGSGLGNATVSGRYVVSGVQDNLFSASVPGGTFSKTVDMFGGYDGGELRLYANRDVTYSSLCLRKASAGKTPKPLPFPECPQYVLIMNSLPLIGGNFFIQKPYNLTNVYDGQIQPASYIAEMSYNYAIYPLVCTTVHIANKQYQQMTALIALLTLQLVEMQLKLDAIIALLVAILAKMMTLPSTCGMFDLLLTIFKMLIDLLLILLKIIWDLIGLVIGLLGDISVEARSGSSATYPFSCSGNDQWTCLALAMLNKTDASLGGWMRIIAWIAVGMLTVQLIWWVRGQVQAMNQPGTEPKDAD
jgi:hypothetical protein